jgi:enoyl-[acyl-carrier-protein] reductase (NADH)
VINLASQWAKIGGQFQRVTLNDYELDNVMTRLLKNNKKEFMRCLETARGLFSEDKDVLEVAKSLYDKQATASFTAVKEALENKIERMKKGEYTEPIEKVDLPEPKKMETKEGTTTEQINTIKEQVNKPIPEAPKPESPEGNASFQESGGVSKGSFATALERTPSNPEFREKTWDPEKGYTDQGQLPPPKGGGL